MVDAYIALGSNLGDRLRMLARAVDGISRIPQTHVERVSHAYESEPAYETEQPPYLNAVICATTTLTSDAFFAELNQLEEELGRIREEANGPRVIDIDLLLFGDEERQGEDLTLPHPRLLEREFVVVPLLAIAPRVKLPDGRHPRRSEATVGQIMRDYGPVPDIGAEHNMPIQVSDWVPVATSEGPQTAIAGFDAALEFKRSVLEQEGIPFAFQPFAPGTEADIFGRPQVIELVVPAEHADRAQELLEAVDNAPLAEAPVDL